MPSAKFLVRRFQSVSLKGHFGHSLSACGTIEAICSINMMKKQLLIPSRNLKNPDPRCQGINLIQKPTKASPEIVLSNNFAFGGMNTTLLLCDVVGEPI